MGESSISVENLLQENRRLAAENFDLKSRKNDNNKSGEPKKIFRKLIGVLCIIAGMLLTPLAVAGYQVKHTVIDNAGFINTFSPILESPEVQEFIVDSAMQAIEEQVDFDAIADSLIGFLDDLGVPSTASVALNLLRNSAIQGAQTLIRSNISNIVSSDFFVNLAIQSSATLHEQAITLLEGNNAGPISIGNNGSLTFDIGFVVKALKESLEEQGIAIARFIPDFQTEIVVMSDSGIREMQTGYQIIKIVSDTTIWIIIALFIVGVLCFPRKSDGLLVVGSAITLISVFLISTISTIRTVVISSIDIDLPPRVALVIYDAFMQRTTHIAQVILTLGIIFLLIGIFYSSIKIMVVIRQYLNKFLSLGRSKIRQVVDVPAINDNLYKFRHIIIVLFCTIAALALLNHYPLTVSYVLWAFFWLILASTIVSLLQNVPEENSLIRKSEVVVSDIAAVVDVDTANVGTGKTDRVNIETENIKTGNMDSANTLEVEDVSRESDK